MQLIRGLQNLPQPLPGSCLTIGNFDGVHRGHQELIAQLLRAARRHQVAPVAFTFNPHPVKILNPEKPVIRLFDFEDQRERLDLLGVQILVEQPFTLEFARVEARDFFENYLLKPLRPKAIVVGHDFAFGRGRSGDHEFLKKICSEHGVELLVVPALQVDGGAVSSTRIREALTAGNLDLAAHLLGRPYYLKGDVRKGEQRGRKIGVPTANLAPLTEFTPLAGVYVTRTRVGTQTFRSITNLGTNPTFESEPGAPIKVETHLFDFAGDLYGREIRVELLKYLRPEKKFSGIDELKQQILSDLSEARMYFGEHV